MSCPVREFVAMPWLNSDPIRGFSWRRDQRHRPGLVFVTSTGRHHGAESLEEGRLLLALDFPAGVIDVVSQPMRLRFDAVKRRAHTPDFLVTAKAGTWLIDVRPEQLIREEDLESFAAAAEVAAACGWGYLVAAGWREHAWAAVDAFSSQRRPLADPLGLRLELLAGATSGAVTFGELAARTRCAPVARAQLLHLLWHRKLGTDLTRPLGDHSRIVGADEAAV